MKEYISKVNGDFPDWRAIEKLRVNDRRVKKFEREIAKIARDWLPYPIMIDGTGLRLAKAPFGTYDWVFCVELEQELIWNFQEFQQGREYGRSPGNKKDRDSNPYNERSRRRSWDRGYILGLHEKRGD